MNRITLLSVFVFLFFYSASAQESKLAIVDKWIEKSEKVNIPDSILYMVKEESQRKQIPEKIMNKNMIYVRMLFNPQFSKAEKIRIADYILEVFNGYENSFVMELVLHTKHELIKP